MTKYRLIISAVCIAAFLSFVIACGGGGGGGDSDASRNSNQVPTIDAIDNQVAYVGQLFTLQVVGRDPQGQPLTYSLTIYPEGMTINSASGVIEWTPAASQGGNNSVVVSAADAYGGSGSASFTVSVEGSSNNVPVLTGISDQPSLVGETFTYYIEAVDPDGDTLSYELIDGPAGMSVNAENGLLSWTPTADDVGYTKITIAAKDTRGGIAYTSFRVAVPEPGNRPPVIPELTEKTATEGTSTAAYGNILVNDPDGDSLTYSLFLDYSEPTPSWLQLFMVSGGVNIYWNPPSSPPSSGKYNLTLMADDSKGGIDIRTFTLTVSPASAPAVAPNNNPTFDVSSTPNNLSVDALKVFRTYVVASDPDGDTVVFTVKDGATGAAVSGLSIRSRISISGTTPISTGIIEWRPTRAQVKAATYDLQIIASDGHKGEATFHLMVDVNMATIKKQVVKVGSGAGEQYDFPLPYIGADYNWTLTSKPAWMSMSPVAPAANSARLTGTLPVGQSTVSIELSVKNSSAVTVDTVTFDIVLAGTIKTLRHEDAPTEYSSITKTGVPYVGDNFLFDCNGDGRDDVVVAGDGANGTTRYIYRWISLANGQFGLQESFALYKTPNFFPMDGLHLGANSLHHTTSLNNISSFAIGEFYHYDVRDFIYVVNDGGCKVFVLPMDYIDNTPFTATPYVTFQTNVVGTPSLVDIADVYNAPPQTDGSDYDNGTEVLFIVRDNRQLVVVNGKGVPVQTLNLAHDTCDNNGYSYCMTKGDFDGDGLTDVAVTTWQGYNDTGASGFYRTVTRMEIFLQESVSGTYQLVSKGLYTLDMGDSPAGFAGEEYYKNFLRPVRSISAGDINGDGKDEIGVSYQMWTDVFNNLNYNNHFAYYGYVKMYQYGGLLSTDTFTPSTAVQTINQKNRVWLSTMTLAPAAFQVRVTDDDGATWTTYTSSTHSALNVQVNCISSTHRNPIAALNTIAFDKRYFWFGTNGNGLLRFDGYNNWTVFTSSNTTSAGGGPGLLNDTIQVAEMIGGSDDDTTKWSNFLHVGTPTGLFRWSGDATSMNQGWATMTGLLDNDVRVITPSEWNSNAATGYYKAVSTATGQVRFDSANTAAWATTNAGITKARDGYHCADDNNLRWYATDQGVYAQAGVNGWGATVYIYSTSNASSQAAPVADVVTGITFGGPGTSTAAAGNWRSTRWVCTSSAGAARMIDVSSPTVAWEIFTTANGLPNNQCTKVDVDSRQNIWLGTLDGLVKFSAPTASPWNKYNPTTLLPGVRVYDVYVEPHAWNQIADIKIADATGDGKPDLIVAANGSVYSTNTSGEQRLRDLNKSISAKISIVEQVYTGGAFRLTNYTPNTPYREAYLNNIYRGRDASYFYMPYRRHVIAVGDVQGDGYPDIGVTVQYGAVQWSNVYLRALVYKMVVN